MDNYSNEEFMIARLGFLSDCPNSHNIKISKEVLQACAPTALGKFLVAEIADGDATSHTPQEKIVGYVPSNQDIRYADVEGGFVKAVADVVISKVYASEFCEIFDKDDGNRSVSVEMLVDEESDSDNSTIARGFEIYGITVLGKDVLPSCPCADINITRFAEIEEKRTLFQQSYSLWKSEEQTEENGMAKDNNFAEFAPEIIDQVREHEGNDVEVVGVEDDHIIFNKDGKQFKVEALISENNDGELECAVNWESVEEIAAEPSEEGDGEANDVEEQAEEQADEQAKEDEPPAEEQPVEEDVEAESTEVEAEESVEDGEDAECADEEECAEEVAEDEECACGDNDKLAELEAIIMAKDEIIATMEAELAELRAFKEECDNKARDFAVQSTLESVKDCFDAETFEALKEEGFALTLDAVDSWANALKARAFDVAQTKKTNETFSGIWRMSVPTDKENKQSLWK